MDKINPTKDWLRKQEKIRGNFENCISLRGLTKRGCKNLEMNNGSQNPGTKLVSPEEVANHIQYCALMCLNLRLKQVAQQSNTISLLPFNFI